MSATRTVRTRRRPAAPRNPLHNGPASSAGMVVGYARTSTVDQVAGFEAQLRDLAAAGATKIFQEQTSSVCTRPQLAACLEYVREHDALVVTRLSRLARSTAHLLQIVEQLERKGCALKVLDPPIDTSTAHARLMLTMIGAIAEFELALMKERQLEGIQKAKLAGKYRGRAPTARAKLDQIRELKAAGVGASESARRLGIGRASVYRLCQEDAT
jgi:DNA invertase Pin-like site-specific DNA recombinase